MHQSASGGSGGESDLSAGQERRSVAVVTKRLVCLWAHLSLLAGLPDQHPGVWAHAAIGNTNVGGEQGDLLHSALLYQCRLELLLCGYHHAIGSLDAQRGGPLPHRIERVFDLDELAAGAEGCKREGILHPRKGASVPKVSQHTVWRDRPSTIDVLKVQLQPM